jgi:glucose/mannose transport system substrate-binding protein
MKRILTLALLLIMSMSMFGAVVAQDAPSGDLEIFSWWTGGGEEAGLLAMIEAFKAKYPDVNIINSAVAGGSGVNARAVLTTRMLGGDPPDTFQVHAGEELNALWVNAGLMEPLNDIYEENGWLEQFPQGLVDLISDDEGNIYVVPVNIHRSNVLWFVPSNLEEWGVAVPATWDEFLSDTCPKLQEQGVTPLAIAENWTQVHLWESVALAVLGEEAYNGLWDGTTSWTSTEAAQVWTTLDGILKCANDDMNALTWQDASKRVADGEAAFNIMGDWAAGLFLNDLQLEPGTDFAWAASPGTDGVFIMLSDTFGLPVGAPNPDAVNAWLSFLGSAEAQDIFNPIKGSLPANTTADITNTELYNQYFQDAYEDWTTNEIVGSLAHEAVGAGEFLNGFSELITQFAASRDVETAVAFAVELAADALPAAPA